MNTTEEIWKDIPGYEGIYQISSFGRARSLDRVTSHGHKLKGKVLAPRYAIYVGVNLSKNDVQTSYNIHVLVATVFIENPLRKEYVNHIDGNKWNNNVWNLEWCTPIENARHAVITGLHKPPSYSPVWQKIQVTIGGDVKTFPAIRKASRELGINRSRIKTCLLNKSTYQGYTFCYLDVLSDIV